MEGKFIIKPAESMVEEVERWLNFLPSDPIRIDTDEIHHLVSGALNVVIIEGQSKTRTDLRLKEAIDNTVMSATKVCGNYDVMSGDEYLLQITDSAKFPLTIEEINAVNEFCSELRPDVDLVWGISRSDDNEHITVKILVKNLKITQSWE